MTSRTGVFVAAAVQAAPVYLDRGATVAKVCALIRQAGRAGARLVAFPEVFIPGFPHWIYLDRPQANERYFVELVREAVEVPGPATEELGRAAREAGAWVVVGVNERSRRSMGELFNTNLIFAPDGSLLGWHRKLMPTYAEKMIWSFTGILGPNGKVIAGPAGDDVEEIVYGTIDLEAIIGQKIHHDVAGNYNRFDVLSLVLNRSPLTAIREVEAAAPGMEITGPETWRLLEDLRRRAGSASLEEIRTLVESLLASVPDRRPTST